MQYISHSPLETETIGAALGKIIPAGTVIAYRGDLGAGKTAFTRGLARGLGYQEPVTSPTYTVCNEYLGGRLPLFHFDMYRLRSAEDLWDIGWMTTWTGAASAPWNGAKTWPMPWRTRYS